jgi:VWFA-related protein
MQSNSGRHSAVVVGHKGQFRWQSRSGSPLPNCRSEPLRQAAQCRHGFHPIDARSKGLPAAGLTRQDFTLFDNGKPQNISFFSVRSEQTPLQPSEPGKVTLPAKGVTNRTERDGETMSTATVLLIDQKNTPQAEQAFAIQRIAKFVQMRRRKDRIGIYTFGKDHVTHAAQELTDNSDLLSQAVASLKARDPSYRSSDTTDMTEHAARGFTALELMERGMDTKHALEGIARHLAKMPGRKSVVWITTGFPLVARDLGIDFTSDMESAARTLNDANVALYAVDARGLSGALTGLPGVPNAEFGGRAQSPNAQWPQQMGARRNTADPPGLRTMNLLANLTGGQVFYNKSNALEESIQKAVEDGESIYTLGFYPAEETQDGAWHKVKVQVDRRGLQVRYRQNYFAAGVSVAVPDRPTLEYLFQDPLDATQLELIAEAVSDPERPGFTQIKVNVNLHDVHLDHENARNSGRIDVSVHREGSGTVQTKSLKIDIPDDQLAALLEKGIDTIDSVETIQGSNGIGVVVQDRVTGAAGSVRVPMGGK